MPPPAQGCCFRTESSAGDVRPKETASLRCRGAAAPAPPLGLVRLLAAGSAPAPPLGGALLPPDPPRSEGRGRAIASCHAKRLPRSWVVSSRGRATKVVEKKALSG